MQPVSIGEKKSDSIQTVVSAPPASDFVYNISARSLTRLSLILAGIMLIAHLITYFLVYLMPDRDLPKLIVFRFGLDRDGNVPTLFSSFLLFTSSILLFLIYQQAKLRSDWQYLRHWLLLSLIFLFLGIDEATMLHELSSGFVKAFAGRPLTGLLKHAWVLPYFILSVAVGLYYLRFVLQLPPATRNMFLLAGFLYVGSALGFELLENVEESATGKHNFAVRTMQTVEEVLEMGAIILFNHALMKYLGNKHIAVNLKKAGN